MRRARMLISITLNLVVIVASMSSVAQATPSAVLLVQTPYYADYAMFLSPGPGPCLGGFSVAWSLIRFTPPPATPPTQFLLGGTYDEVGIGCNGIGSRVTNGLGPCLNGAIFGLPLPPEPPGLTTEQQAWGYFNFLVQEAQQCLAVFHYTLGSPGSPGSPATLLMPPTFTVPQWFQNGVPLFENGIPVLGGGYPGNAWDGVGYDSEPPFTIGEKGCYLTSLTMVVNYWKSNLTSPMNPTPPYPGLDPTVLNNWKALFDDSTGNIIQDAHLPPDIGLVRVFPNIGNASSSNGFTIINNDSIQTLNNILRNNVPVILQIVTTNATGNKAIHFVVLTGMALNGDYLVNDAGAALQSDGKPVQTLLDLQNTPWWNGHVKSGTPPCLSCSLGDVNNFIVYTPKDKAIAPTDPNTAQALSLYTNGPVELILTDPLGRQTGFDPVASTSFQTIPVSVYSTTIYSDEKNFSPDPPPFKALYMANQMPGQYTLNVIGTGNGNFTVTVRASDAAGNWVTQTYSGTTATGISSQFTFQGAVTAFSAFGANLRLSSPHQAFEVDGAFTSGPGGAISPLTQPLTIQIGNTLTATIPAGSFQQTPQGTFFFGGVIQGMLLAAELTPTGGNSYGFAMAGVSAPNLPNVNPVDVQLAIGSNGGSTSVTATFLP